MNDLVERAPTQKIIRPIRDNILVKQDKPKEKLASGLFVPQNARELHEDFGTVIAVGPGRVLDNGVLVVPEVKPGDRVLFRRRPASLLDGEEDLLMLKDDDILAVIDE